MSRQMNPRGIISRPVARDLSSYQYHAAQITTSNTVDYVDTSSAGVGWGVLQGDPDTAGDVGEISTSGTSLMYVDGNSANIAIGAYLGSNSNYHGVAVTTNTSQYFAIALSASPADGDLIEVKLVGPGNTIAA